MKIFANLSVGNYSSSCAVGLHSAILVGKGRQAQEWLCPSVTSS